VRTDPLVLPVLKNSFPTFGRTPQTGVGPSQGLYVRRTAQHRKKRIYIHASSGIRTHDARVRAAKTQALDPLKITGKFIKITGLSCNREAAVQFFKIENWMASNGASEVLNVICAVFVNFFHLANRILFYN
jgi:hypothetical protein